MTITIHLPQVLWVILAVLALTIHIGKHGEQRDPYNGGLAILSFAIELSILYFGGFFG